MTDEEQNVPWFGTPTGFTQKRKFRRVRRLAGKDRAAELAGWYAHMRDLAKQGTTFGVFATDVESFVESFGGVVPDLEDDTYMEWFADAASLWQAFIDAHLISVEGDPAKLAQGFRVRVLDFEETNRPRMSSGRRTSMSDEERRAKDAERKRRERAERKSAFAGMSASCPDVSTDASVSALGIGEDRIGEDRKQQGASTHAPTPLPASPRTIPGQIRTAQRDLGSHVSQVIVAMIGRRNSDAARMLTEHDELQQYWKPACELLAEHGPLRLRIAANRAGEEAAVRIGFLATICKAEQRTTAAAVAADPDLAQNEWDDYMGISATATDPTEVA